METEIRWWGYLHVGGEIIVRRYFDNQDLIDAQESSFVARFCGPFQATCRNDALEKARRILDGN